MDVSARSLFAVSSFAALLARLRTVTLAAGVLLACAPLSSQSAETSLCTEFRQLSSTQADRTYRTHLQTSFLHGGEEQYFNLDLDGDDLNDVVQGGCAASLEAADPCYLLIRFSSGKVLDFTFELEERFFLMRHKSKVYAVATLRKDGELKRSILDISTEGATRICTDL